MPISRSLIMVMACFFAVGRVGLEPTTYGLKTRRDGLESTAVVWCFLLPSKGFSHVIESARVVY
jgi:hypothetical protein